MCARTWSPRPISARTRARVVGGPPPPSGRAPGGGGGGGWGGGGGGGEHGLIKHVDEKNSVPFVSEKQRLL